MSRILDHAAWNALGDRLSELNPERFEETLDCVREIVECQEVLASGGRQAPARWVPGDERGEA